MSLNAAQTDDTPSDTQVLIIGAGPAGLFAASELLRHGVRPRIVEQRQAPHRETRGTALQPAVLETLDKGGVLEPFLADSMRIKQIELLGPGLQRIALVELAGLGCKYEFQCSQPQGARRRCCATIWRGRVFRSNSARRRRRSSRNGGASP